VQYSAGLGGVEFVGLAFGDGGGEEGVVVPVDRDYEIGFHECFLIHALAVVGGGVS